MVFLPYLCKCKIAMRKYRACIFCAVVAAALLAGCTEPDNRPEEEEEIVHPRINIGIDTPLEFPAEGGRLELPVSISNPVRDGKVDVLCYAPWIIDITVGTDTVAVVDAARNMDPYVREAQIVVTYTYSRNYKDVVLEMPVKAVQSAAGDTDWDIEVDAVYADAAFLSESDGVMDVKMVFTDMEVDEQGKVTPPGTILYVEALMPFDMSGAPVPGQYGLNAMDNEPFTFFPGQVEDYDGTPVTMGSYAVFCDEDGGTGTVLVADGEMIIGLGFDGASVDCAFVLEDGRSLRSTYTGSIYIDMQY